MTEYPAKPSVTPQTGRTPNSNNAETNFLDGVTTSELRLMTEFQSGPMYMFLVKHMEKKIRNIERGLGTNIMLAKEPILLSAFQGEIKGTREFMKFFDAVAIEYNRRLTREEALNQSER